MTLMIAMVVTMTMMNRIEVEMTLMIAMVVEMPMMIAIKVAMTLIIVMMVVVTIMVMPITSVMVMTTVNFVHMIYPVQVLRGKVFSTRPRNALLSFAPTLTRLKNSQSYGPDPGPTQLYFAPDRTETI